MLSSDSLETSTGSSNSFRSTIQSIVLCTFRKIPRNSCVTPSNEELRTGGIFIGGLGNAGEMLDEPAKVANRRRLSELREELEEAKELGKVERAEQAESTQP